MFFENKLVKDEKGRIFFWDNIKFFLILCVVIGHAADFYTKTDLKMRLVYLIIYTFHMPLFIFISGYFSKKIINEKRFKIEKVFSYLLLYIVLKMCFYVLNKFVLNYPNVKFNIFIESNVPWYLLSISIWCCITYIIRNIKPKYAITLSFLLGILVGYDKTVGDFLCLSRIIVFYPFYIIGYYFGEEDIVKILENKKMKVFILLLTLIIVLGAVLYCDNLYFLRGFFTGRNSYEVLKQLVFGAIYRIEAYIISIIISLSIIYAIPKRKLLVTNLGKRTLQVYFLHFLFLQIYYKYNINQIIIGLCPKHWKMIYLLIWIGTTFILSLRLFEYPFKRIMNIELKRYSIKMTLIN